MSGQSTLNSRLRVLVAKTFRAEKLYSSIRSSRAEKIANLTVLSEMANDIRAREWQRCHYQLRIALNDLLSLGAGSAVVEELSQLLSRFKAKTEESLQAIDKGSESLVETARRQEFAHIFKMSAELIRHKARAQACKVIVDELMSVLDASGKDSKLKVENLEISRGLERIAKSSVASKNANSSASNLSGEESEVRSNVIPLRRRVGLG